MKKLLFASAAVAALAASGFAQSLSSFNTVTSMSGITITTPTSLDVNLAVALGASFVYLGNTYHVERVFGVWSLDTNDDMSASGGAQNSWGYDSNYAGSGGIVGWKTNPNSGMAPGATSLTYHYTTLAGTVENHGMHIRTIEQLPTGGNTAYFKYNAVPEPASVASFGLAGLALLLRRKRA